MKEFKAVEKAQILAAARNQYNMFISKRQKLENKLNVTVSGFDFETKLEEYRVKLQWQLDAKTAKLHEEIAANRRMQDAWTPQALKELLGGYSIEDLVEFSYHVSDTGKRSLVANFKYDTVLPPTDEEAALMPEETESAPQEQAASGNADAVTEPESAAAEAEAEVSEEPVTTDEPEAAAVEEPEEDEEPAPAEAEEDFLTDPEEEEEENPWADDGFDSEDTETATAEEAEEDPFAIL